ncbi:uncharacterized protein LOC120481195 isoform X1 [Pimephales promelas]|uniref:uncharacterized protein LOC120481195 isoform X1 n=1 Tax=Pimephales promelas TaxID=90988 RepID=UPI001955667B|nr:uncharacterized protein LOC120481195 isoform X1 [Pimephales promelas]
MGRRKLVDIQQQTEAHQIITTGVVLFSQNQYGAEVEMKVRPGDSITLYCDRSITLGFRFVWIRNGSHENQPSLVIDFRKWDLELFKRYIFVHNRSSNSHDLHITNISVSDLGLYYCAEVGKVYKDKEGILFSSEVYYYGKQTTRLSFAESVSPHAEQFNITSTLPLSDCVLCWTLLFSVCPVCVLLSSLLSSMCVYCLCRAQTPGSEQSADILTVNFIKGDPPEKHQCETSKTGENCLHTEVSYRLLTSSYPYVKM